jgi:squalene-hopene/tetraprenyl-beta-curcumene cyclase
MATPELRSTRTELAQALGRARDHLLSLQSAQGWWKGELASNVTMDAEDLLLREFLGIREQGKSARSAAWIRSQQRADGTWANFYGGPGDLSTTIEAYWALRLVGDPPEAQHMRAAAEFIRDQGGIARARVFTHVWLALFGLWPWQQVPALPPEITLAPPWLPLNIYDFGCWARQTIVALSIVRAYEPVRPLPFDLAELHSAPYQKPQPRSRAGHALALAESLWRRYERIHPRALRELALARAERWVVARQEADGSWGGIQPPWVYSLMALQLRGYPLDHPVMRAGIEGIEGFMIEEEGTRRLEACQSPVWDTALALIALRAAGVEAEHPALLAAGRWLIAQEVRHRGDWAVRRPELAPGGWAFEFANVNYPDVDDTAEVVLALLALQERRHSGEPAQLAGASEAIERARRWVEGMQSKDGGWGAFDADNTRALVRELPFLDFGEVIDAPSADVTAHALEMLAALGRGESECARAGCRRLLELQEQDGSWFGRWGVNHIYGTAAALPALIACGFAPEHPAIRRAVAWLYKHQNEDGGFGEDCRSYRERSWIGRGESTASQTAWALLALHAAGERGERVARALGWLVESQRADGTWDEPHYTGTGFPGDYYINYHLYRLIFPVLALGRYAGLDSG